MGPTTTPTPTRTLGMRLSCNFVNVYTFTRVHARIPNGQPREDLREEKRACRLSRRTSRRGLSCVSGSWQAERGSRRTRRHPRDDPRAEVGEDVRVRVGVGPMEFKLDDYSICDCVCLCVRALKEKPLELSTPNLLHIYCIAGHRHALTLRSKC